jgi:hypothetical protein
MFLHCLRLVDGEKFAKTNIVGQRAKRHKEPEKVVIRSKNKKVQPKKSGRGWLHK